MWIVGECCARVSPLRWVAFFLVVLLGVAFAATGQEDSKPFGGELPLWEPYWSPETFAYPTAVVRAVGAADTDQNGVTEIIVAGDLLREFSYSSQEGRFYENQLHLYDHLLGDEEHFAAEAVASGDVNGDGWDDLVVSEVGGPIWVFVSRTDRRVVLESSVNSPLAWDGSPFRLWLIDHTGDGFLDLCVSDNGRNVVYLLAGDGQGGFGERVLLEGTQGRPFEAAGGEYRGDSGTWVLTIEGLWFFPQGEIVGTRVDERGGKGLFVGDLDGDGDSDVAVGHIDGVTVLELSEGEISNIIPLPLDFEVSWILGANLNGDCWTELVAGAYTPGGFAVFYNVGDLTFEGPHLQSVAGPGALPSITTDAVAADFNEDGRDEIAIVVFPRSFVFFQTTPSGRTCQALPGSFLLGVGDVNRDGAADLLCEASEGGVTALLNAGQGLFVTEPLIEATAGLPRGWTPYIARLADTDGDEGDELVVWGFSDAGTGVAVWRRGSGGWEFSWFHIFEDEVLPLLLTVDLDSDGRDEIVTAAGSDVIVLKDNGTDASPFSPCDVTRIDWGGPVGPLVGFNLEKGGAVAGFRLSPEAVQLLVLRGRDVEETELILEIAPLDLVAADVNGDGLEDLASVGLGVTDEDGEPRLTAVGGFLINEGGGRFTSSLSPIPDWPSDCWPFPYGGLTVGDFAGDERLDLAVMRLASGAGSPGGVVIMPQCDDGFDEPIFLEECVGTKLFALDLDGDGRSELAYAGLGTPARLCLAAWRR
jgi:hypothetical protein